MIYDAIIKNIDKVEITPRLIKKIRLENDLTQSQAAKLVHAATRSWQCWESGSRAMNKAIFELFLIKLTEK